MPNVVYDFAQLQLTPYTKLATPVMFDVLIVQAPELLTLCQAGLGLPHSQT